MTRCFASPSQWTQAEVALSREESHHLLTVLRARQGEQVSLFDGQGRVARAEVIGTVNKRVRVRILAETVRDIPRPHVSITLVQAMPKGALIDGIIQKATELGISSVIPTLTDRVIVRRDGQGFEDRLSRWRRIALEAAKQCGATWIPDIHPAMPLNDLVAQLSRADLCIVGSLQREAKPLREVMKTTDKSAITSVTLIIGPEGDLADHEYAALYSAGAIPVSLGPHVLRVETAALFGMSVLVYEFAPCGASGKSKYPRSGCSPLKNGV